LESFLLKRLPPEVERLKEVLLKDSNVLFAYLFGSYAAGLQCKESDVDLAVYFKEALRPLELLDYLHFLSEVAGRYVHLVSLNSASPFLKFQVLKTGLPLVVRNREALASFKERVMVEREEYLWMRKVSDGR
jgi:predicted nucleotidyltransferase